MLKSFIRRIFPAVAVLSPKVGVTNVQHAIIEALAAHLRRLGHPIESVRVPGYSLDNDTYCYQTAAADFAVIRGLDASGDNVVSGFKASGTVEAATVADADRNENFNREAAEAAVLASPSTLDLRHLRVLDVDLIGSKMRERYENQTRTRIVVVSPEGQRSLAGDKVACVSWIGSDFGDADIYTMRLPTPATNVEGDA